MYTRIRSFILLDVGGSACRDKAKFFTAASMIGVRSSSCFLQLERKKNSIEKNSIKLDLFMVFAFLQDTAI